MLRCGGHIERKEAMQLTVRDRFEGALLGAACGDALGACTEQLTSLAIKARFKGQLAGFPSTGAQRAEITDDTRLTLCVADMFIAKGDFSASDLAARIIDWSSSPESYHSPSRTFMRAAKALSAHRDSSKRGSDEGFVSAALPSTCGDAVARTVPVGLFFMHDLARCASVAAAVARLTHADPCAEAAAISVALAAAQLTRGLAPESIITTIGDAVSQRCEEFHNALTAVETCLSFDTEAAFNFFGRSADLQAVVPCAFYCLNRHPNDFSAAVLTAVNAGGKADSIACLVGALAGCRLGRQAIPVEWLDAINDVEDISRTAGLLESAAAANSP